MPNNGNGLTAAQGSIIGAGIGTLGNFLGGMFGNWSNQDYNRRMMQEQNAFTEKMYNKQVADAYSWYHNVESPMAMRQAYMDAGFSPTAMLGNSAPSAPSISAQGANAPYQNNNAFQGLGDNITRAMDMYRNELTESAQRENLIQDAESKRLDNEMKSIEVGYARDNYIQDKLANRYSLTKGFDSGAAASMDNYINGSPRIQLLANIYDKGISALRSAEIRLRNSQSHKNVKDADLAEAQKNYTETKNKWEPILNRATIGLQMSHKATLDKMRDVNYLTARKNLSWIDALNDWKTSPDRNSSWVKDENLLSDLIKFVGILAK